MSGPDPAVGDPTGTPDEVPATLGSSFDPHRNSLNFLRLALALTVVASHSIDLGLFGHDWIGNRATIGQMAVFGFFGISGYLIAGSAERNGSLRYLWQRFLRIFPAFWVCLVVTAFGIAFLEWLHLERVYHFDSPVSAYFTAANGPIGYVTRNWYLKINQYAIINTVWNGSLWTLFYEFLCYLILAVLARAGLFARRHIVLIITVAVWLVDLACTVNPRWQSTRSAHGTNDLRLLIELVPVFLTGTLLYLYRDRVRDSGWYAVACGLGLVASLWLPFGGRTPALTLTSTGLLAPLIAYPMLWLGIHLPFRRVGVRNDYSYGVYIYAYPVQVFLGPWGVTKWGLLPFFLLSVAGTVPLAVASWWLVERPALRLKKWTPGQRPAHGSETPGAKTPAPQVQSPDASGLEA